MRRLAYVTGTRADFGLMLPVLREIASARHLCVELLVTGMHLSHTFGHTVSEVEASGLPIAARIPLPIDDDSAQGMSRCAGGMAAAMADYLADRRPDILLLLGDRSEMLAAGLPALLASIPIVHLCGGERSGTVDESIRHAITKIAHIHMVANEDAAQRVLHMGEEPWRIHRVGAPGLVGLKDMADVPLTTIADRYGFEPDRPYALMLFHSVVQDAARADLPVRLALQCLEERGLAVVCLLPNADHGSGLIRQAMADAQSSSVALVTHMPRHDYVSALASATVLIGNSSSGIVEAATLATPVVNIGDRQRGRARNDNVFDAVAERNAIAEALDQALRWRPGCSSNIYGDGETHRRVASILANTDWEDSRILKKQMTY